MPTDLAMVSLCAGVGGIDLAAERVGIQTRVLCEIDKHCRKVLAHRFPDAVLHDDMRTLTADDLRAAGLVPERTILAAGWPCQGNSVAGSRGGMADPRSGLWSHVARLLREFQPAWFLGENVPGLLSVGDGGDFAVVLDDLADAGYGLCSRVLDARHFGVPQRRRRVVIVGHLGDSGAAPLEILAESEGVRGDSASRGEARTGAASGAREGVAVGQCHGSNVGEFGTFRAGNGGVTGGVPFIAFGHTNGIDLQADDEVYPTIRAGHDAMPSIAYVADEVGSLMAGGGDRGYRIDADEAAGGQLVAYPMAVRGRDGGADLEIGRPGDPMFALRAGDGGSSRSQLIAVHENQRGEIAVNDTLGALDTGGGKPGQGYPAVTDGVIVRRLTPLECERLQGFPDQWTAVGEAPDSQRYKQMGNSVAVPVFTWTLGRLVRVDQRLQERAA